MKDSDGNQITIDNNVIGEFTNENHLGKNVYTEICYDNTIKAGTYTGYVDFYIEVKDK